MPGAIRTAACLVLPLLLVPSVAEANGKDIVLADSRSDEIRTGTVIGSRGRHLNTDDRIRDLLGHPAFAGFAGLLLPWDGRSHDQAMRPSDIGSLLPYHRHVDPKTVVGAVNRMIDDVNSGHAVFFPFYSEEQKQKKRAREKTGLFFFRGKPSAPFAVISPGGGFSYVGAVHDGFPYATETSAMGYNAFVLRYRAGYGGAVATEDLAAAISYIFRNAKALGVSVRDYSLWGSSAGARMAAAIGSHGVAAHGGDKIPRPSAVMMAYTAHSDFSTPEPRLSSWSAKRTAIVPPASMERRIAACAAQEQKWIPQVQKSRSWLRARNRDQRRRLDRGRRSVLGKIHHPTGLMRRTPRCSVCFTQQFNRFSMSVASTASTCRVLPQARRPRSGSAPRHFQLFRGHDRGLDQTGRVPHVGALQRDGHQRPGVQIDGVLRFGGPGACANPSSSVSSRRNPTILPILLDVRFFRRRSSRANVSRVGVLMPDAAASRVRNS